MAAKTVEPQTYANHVRRVPLIYWAGALALVAQIGVSVYALWIGRWIPGALGLLSAAGAGVALYYARTNALVVQTRLVCLEERLRLERLLPADLRARLPELSADQLVATRFASDGEVAELVRAVLDERLARRKEIKRRVRDWRADWHRV